MKNQKANQPNQTKNIFYKPVKHFQVSPILAYFLFEMVSEVKKIFQ